jgi:hypothetical protein
MPQDILTKQLTVEIDFGQKVVIAMLNELQMSLANKVYAIEN